MGLIDGAGAALALRTRLEAVGVPEFIALAVGQTISDPIPGFPRAVISSSEVKLQVGLVEKELQRIQEPLVKEPYVMVLCVQIFGDINGYLVSDIGYPPRSGRPDTRDTSREELAANVMLDQAISHLSGGDVGFLPDRVMLPGSIEVGNPGQVTLKSGFLMAMDGMIGFFNQDGRPAIDHSQGAPVIRRLRDLQRCTAWIPDSVILPPLARVALMGRGPNFLADLSFVPDMTPMRIWVLFNDLDEDLKSPAAEGIQQVVTIAERALGKTAGR